MKKVLDYIWTFCAGVGALAFAVAVIGFTAGYATEKYTQRSDRCINSACDSPCKASARFKRHAGCAE